MKYLGALCAGLLAVPAVAADSNPFAAETASVRLADLDLATADGQQRLALRLDEAARSVCGQQLAEIHLAVEAKGQACRAAVVADARAKIESRLAQRATKGATRLASLR